MALLHIESLPPQTTKGTIVRLLIQIGKVDRAKIGRIEVVNRTARVEIPDRQLGRAVKLLDGENLANRKIHVWGEPSSLPATFANEHFARLAHLLQIEAAAEAERVAQTLKNLTPRDAEQSGHSIVDLIVREEHAGLGGHVLVLFAKRSGTPFVWTRLGIGAPVVLSNSLDETRLRGVVSRKSALSIEVAFPQALPAEISDSVIRLDLSNDEIARTRQHSALLKIRSAVGDRLSHLRQVLLGEARAEFQGTTELSFFNEGLDTSQQETVTFALSGQDVALIHGPPGTGKTTALVEIVQQAVSQGDKVLACAPSNTAVDNLFQRLLGVGEKVVRLGHPARVLPELRNQTLDLMVESHDDTKLVRKLTREAHALFHKAARFTRAKPEVGERREMREEAKRLLEDARRLEVQVVQQILDDADVVCATLTGLDTQVMGQRNFDLAVIDEACQTTEPACWIPLLRSNRVILAGDHCQLPPTVISREAEAEGFGISMFERLMQMGEDELSRRLTVQYRMHRDIMQFSSKQFYQGGLVAHPSVATHCLADLEAVDQNEQTSSPVIFIDTAGAGFEEEMEPDGESRRNPSEAKLVLHKLQELREAGLTPPEIAIIAPYAAQVRLIRSQCAMEGLEIDTVDGFQGREKEVILITCVRSNAQGAIGFLADTRRINVALTRARRKLIVVGDSATIGAHPFYQQLLEYFEGIGAYHTVWEETLET
ncbi:MAG: AAA domain-containing protein [Pirellulaceae bacterium]|nr:AAA domain-containing protein [Pirellulaceae bacterium]